MLEGWLFVGLVEELLFIIFEPPSARWARPLKTGGQYGALAVF